MTGPGQTADATGREHRLLMEGVANIKEWGAVGDGVADDTAAVQAAICAVTASASGAPLQFAMCCMRTSTPDPAEVLHPFV